MSITIACGLIVSIFQEIACLVNHYAIHTWRLSLSSLYNMKEIGMLKPLVLEHILANDSMPHWLILDVKSITHAMFEMIVFALSNISFVCITNTKGHLFRSGFRRL